MDPAPPRTPIALRRVGGALFLAFITLIVVGVLIKEPWPSDSMFLFIRWPVWVLFGVFAPLLVLRVVLWQRRRRDRQQRELHRAGQEPPTPGA